MLKNLVNELAQIDKAEKDARAFTEAVECGTSLPDDCPACDPGFEKAVAILKVPEDATEEAKHNYITDTIDKSIYPDKKDAEVVRPETDGRKFLVMTDEDYQKVSGAIAEYSKVKTLENKIIIQKFVCNLIKYLETAADQMPGNAQIYATVNAAYNSLTDHPTVTDERVSPKASLLDKLKAVAKAL